MLSVTKLYEVIFPSWKHDSDEASQALGRGIWQQDNSLFLKNGFSAFLNSMATIFYLILHVWTWMTRWGEGERWWWGFLWSLWRDKHTEELKQVVLRNLRMQLEELVSGTDAGRNGSSPLSTNIIAVDLAEAWPKVISLPGSRAWQEPSLCPSLGPWDWESQFLGRLIRSPGVPKDRGRWGSGGGDRGLEFSKRRRGQMFVFFPLHSLVLVT